MISAIEENQSQLAAEEMDAPCDQRSLLQPVVFVMNPYYTGIGIARNLHGLGIRVYTLYSSNSAPGLRSRFFTGAYRIPDGRDQPDRLCERLIELGNLYDNKPVLFPTRDFDVLFLHNHRNELTPFYRIAQPGGPSLSLLQDKSELATLALSIDIKAPRTAVCTSPDDLREQMAQFSFPLVLKPRWAYQWRLDGVWEKIGARKAVFVESAQQLVHEYNQLKGASEEVLIQEYVEGTDSDVVVCCCYIDTSGELLGYFTARKVRQSPPLFGTGCVVELAEIPEIVALTEKLLRAAGYVGLAEVEFKHDKNTDTFFLIEINTRHWDQHQLGREVGVNLTWLAYQAAIGQSLIPQVPNSIPCTRGKWIAERELVLLTLQDASTEISRIRADSALSWMAKGTRSFWLLTSSAREQVRLLRDCRVFGVWHPRDPLPGILMFFRFFLEMSSLCITRLQRLLLSKGDLHKKTIRYQDNSKGESVMSNATKTAGQAAGFTVNAEPHGQNGNLLTWSKEQASSFGSENVLATHRLHEHELLSEEALIDLLENYPRNRLQAFTMGTDQLRRDDWSPVDTTGVSGKELLDAISCGRLWFNLLRFQAFDNNYRDLLQQVFSELTALRPDFKPFKPTCTLIISSPGALVYYHADAQPNLLWQIRGTKRVWVYPADDHNLVPQEYMEDIFASFADEEVPYRVEFDQKATIYEVKAGQVLSWPQNAPHRVTNLDSVNVSLSTPYETDESDGRKTVYCANRLFRRKYHIPMRSTKETGLVSYAKRFAFRAWRRAGLIETPPRRAYITDLKIDPKSSNGITKLKEGPVLTEFSREDFSLQKDALGKMLAIPKQ